MEGRAFFALLVFTAFIQGHGAAETDEERDDLSRRAIDIPRVAYTKLKSMFLGMARERPVWYHWGPYWSRPRPRADPSKIDMVFLVDKSGSIGRQNFEVEKRFLADLIEDFPVFPAKTRIAVVSYSTNVKLEFNFKKYLNRECTRKGIAKIRYTGGKTATGKALEYVRTKLIYDTRKGARRDARKVIFILTDGRTNAGISPFFPAYRLRRRGVDIFAMGVTRYIRSIELRFIAGRYSRVFHVRSYAALYQVTRMLEGDLLRKCSSGQTVDDECGRRCKCHAGRLVRCERLRREFTDMSTRERTRYINTVKTASTHPDYKPRYERLLTVHRTFFDSNIHELDFFLPWHRWFILQYENLLREIDCRVTVPYWDWSLVGASPFTSDLWNPGPHGFGGNGTGRQNCVKTGPFREGVWSLVASAGGGCLKRRFNDRAPDAMAVKMLVTEKPAEQFVQFEEMLRFEFHDLVHCIIDGTMCTNDSASAPEFFLHHGFVDKIWWDWQRRSNAHKFNTYFTTQTAIMPSTVYRSRDFLDLNNQPGCVCAEYVPPRSGIYKAIQRLTKEQIRDIPRLPMPPMPPKAMKLFRMKEKDLQRLKTMMKDFKPKKTMSISELKGQDAKQGFKTADVMRKVIVPKRHTG